MKRISEGAEAVIYLADNIIKQRPKKDYRLSELDDSLRKQRTRKEARLLEKLRQIGFPAPSLVSTDKNSTIEMEFIEGEKLRDALNTKNYKRYCKEIGKNIALLHSRNIIHGDLTTSNMIVNDKIYFIDFGLSFHSTKTEDKAVDLHLLKQALDSKHFNLPGCFEQAVSGYTQTSGNPREILQRLEKVEVRGRNKLKN